MDEQHRRGAAHDLRQPLAAASMQAELLATRLTTLGLAADAATQAHLRVLREQLRALAEGIDHHFGDSDAAAPEGESATGRPLAGVLVAIVEDDDAVRAGLEAVLIDAGAFVVAAAGLGAMQAALEGADRMPDLILTDWRLDDGQDGVDVITALRGIAFGRTLPAFVLTADVSGATDALAGLARVELLRKPVSGATLVARLAARSGGR